jgi:hypothetical protein
MEKKSKLATASGKLPAKINPKEIILVPPPKVLFFFVIL